MPSTDRPGAASPSVLPGALATAGALMSAALLLAGVGGIYALGFDGLAIIPGVALGLTLATLLVAPEAGASGAASVPEFLTGRSGRGFACGLMTAVVLGLATLWLAGEMAALSLIVRPLLARVLPGGILAASGGLPVVAVFAVLALLPLMGGRRAVTASLAVLYCLVLLGTAGLAAALAYTHTGSPFAPIAYGLVLPEIDKTEIALVGAKLADGASLKRFGAAFLSLDQLNFAGAIVAVAAGVAGLPQLVTRMLWAGGLHQSAAADCACAPSTAAATASLTAAATASLTAAAAARSAHALALGFVLPVLLCLPALAAFARLDIYRLLARGTPVAALPGWLSDWSGNVRVCGADPADSALVAAACHAIGGHRGLLRLQDLSFDPAVILPALPELAGLPAYWTIAAGAVLAAAALASALATLAMAAALPGTNAACSRPGPLGWLICLGILVAAAAAALANSLETLALAGWVLPLSASVLFPMLALSRRRTGAGLAAGLLTGLGISLYYLITTRYAPVAFIDLWGGLSNAAPAAVRKLAVLREASAATPLDRADAIRGQLLEHARGLANWWGLRPLSIPLLAIPAAVFATIAVSFTQTVLAGRGSVSKGAGSWNK